MFAAVGAVLCAGAALGFGARIEGYAHPQHPLALLGARGIPGGLVFNLLAFVVPGLAVAWTATRLRTAIATAAPGGTWLARVGAQALLLSALAFAAQGVFPLDPEDLDNAASARHAAAWMLWCIAATVAAVLLAVGLRRRSGWSAAAKAAALAAFALPVLALVLPQLMPAGAAQRLAFAAWFAWAIQAGHVAAHRQP